MLELIKTNAAQSATETATETATESRLEKDRTIGEETTLENTKELLAEKAVNGNEDFAALVHSIVTLEDKIIEACDKTETVFDWVAKGGRSLGLD